MADIALDRQLINKIGELDDSQKQRVLAFINDLTEPRLSLGEWLDRAEALQAQFVAKHGPDHFIHAVDLLNEARE